MTILRSIVALFKGKPASSKETTIDPANILFSLPTLCDTLPAFATEPLTPPFRSFHEDNWRQTEILPRANHPFVEKHIAALREFKKAHSVGVGWTNVYVRPEHPKWLHAESIKLSAPDGSKLEQLGIGASFEARANKVLGGFAFADVSGWLLYGQVDENNNMVHLCVEFGKCFPSEVFTAWMVTLMTTNDLFLVDWQGEALVEAANLHEWFTWRAEPRGGVA